MDKSVLLEKRKNLLSGSKNAPELFLNAHFVDLSQLFSENELLNFIENSGITELKINKTDLANKIATIINDASNTNNLQESLASLKITDINFNKNPQELIKIIVSNKLDLMESLLEYSLKAKLEYYDSSV
jgi:hypothetical protein